MRRKAIERQEEARARDLVERLGRPEPLADPFGALMDVAAEAREWQTVLRERLGELRELATFDTFGADRERAVAVMYERSLDRIGRLLVDIGRLDLDGKRVLISATQAQHMLAVINVMFDDLRLNEQQREQARACLARELRKYSNPSPARLPTEALD